MDAERDGYSKPTSHGKKSGISGIGGRGATNASSGGDLKKKDRRRESEAVAVKHRTEKEHLGRKRKKTMWRLLAGKGTAVVAKGKKNTKQKNLTKRTRRIDQTTRVRKDTYDLSLR